MTFGGNAKFECTGIWIKFSFVYLILLQDMIMMLAQHIGMSVVMKLSGGL